MPPRGEGASPAVIAFFALASTSDFTRSGVFGAGSIGPAGRLQARAACPGHRRCASSQAERTSRRLTSVPLRPPSAQNVGQGFVRHSSRSSGLIDRAATGQAAAVPASSVMKSRRCMRSIPDPCPAKKCPVTPEQAENITLVYAGLRPFHVSRALEIDRKFAGAPMHTPLPRRRMERTCRLRAGGPQHP